MITLIVNADDFGYSKGTNYAIIETFKKGIVTSTTMMMNMPETDHAIELAKCYTGLGVGVHLVLTCGKPLSDPYDVPTLVRRDGSFYKKPHEVLTETLSLDEVEKEWRKQVHLFYEKGLTPTHLDSHHHVHKHPLLHPVIEKVGNEFGLPVRVYPQQGKTKPFSDVFRGDFYGKDVSVSLLEKIVREGKDGETIEIMTHPAYIDTALLEGTSYCMERAKETDVLLSWDVPKNVQIYQKYKG